MRPKVSEKFNIIVQSLYTFIVVFFFIYDDANDVLFM